MAAPRSRRDRRWLTGVSATIVLAGVGIGFRRPGLLVVAVLPLAFVVYSSLSTEPAVDAIEVTRSLSTESPAPGDRVTVTVTIHNAGESVVPDLRVIDGVPDRLQVVDGSPRVVTPLPTDGRATLEYTVVAKRGTDVFGEAHLTARNLSGARVVTTEVDVDGAGAIECSLDVEEFPLDEHTIQFAGPLATDSGGPGIEFHSTRDYRAGDQRSRIDWRRLAKTGELTTIEYREHRAARVIVVIDARGPARQAEAAGQPTGAELSLYAAARAVTVLGAAGHEVGLAALGVTDPRLQVPPAWLKPTAGRALAARASELYDAVGAAIDQPAADGRQPAVSETELDRLRHRLPGDAQLLLVSPLLDDGPVAAVETLLAYNYPTTVLSPGATGDRTVGQRVGSLERSVRLTRLRALGPTVIDWDRDRPLQLALTTALKRRQPVG